MFNPSLVLASQKARLILWHLCINMLNPLFIKFIFFSIFLFHFLFHLF